jgi:hypothetical protein
MIRRNWRTGIGLAIVLLSLTGCRSTSTIRKGVSSVETASTPHESVFDTVANAKQDPNPVVPASWTTPATGGECGH